MKANTLNFVTLTREISETFGPKMHSDQATRKQVACIRQAMEECLSRGFDNKQDRDTRLAVLAFIFPSIKVPRWASNGRNAGPSTNNLSKAEASALIQQLYD